MNAIGWMFVVVAVTLAVYLWALARVVRAERARTVTPLRVRQLDTFCETNAARWNRESRERDGVEVERP